MYGNDGQRDCVRAPIARGRVAEMLARGWTVVAIGEEDRVWMEGPDPDGEPRQVFAPLAALARETNRVRAA